MLHDALHAVHALVAPAMTAWQLMSPESRFLLVLPWGIATLALFADAFARARAGRGFGRGRH